ncbi:MAG: enoyl-CoA hydratase/isomerase family protein [Promethearchaeota archaeon]|nr:MAG: enoyl-CoA hydratase/isomerase family protein [Candidatus Lokiarchaeota archaeon]
MEFETLKWELREDGIGIVTLHRPDNLNAISYQMVEDFHRLADYLMVNLDCRVLILRSDGKVFSAGTDLKDGNQIALRKTYEPYKKFFYLNVNEVIKKKVYFQHRISQFYIKMRKLPQPIICLIQGPAVGAALSLTLASDIRIAGPRATFVNAVINLGLVGVDVGSSYFLPRLIGMSRAAELTYTGRICKAAEALKFGLILKIVEEDKLLEAGIEMAKEFLNKSPLGLRMTKDAINLSMDVPSLETLVHLENISQDVCGTSRDLLEGSTAFLQKRSPKYPLR